MAAAAGKPSVENLYSMFDHSPHKMVDEAVQKFHGDTTRAMDYLLNKGSGGEAMAVDEDPVQQLIDMGFDEDSCREAMKKCRNNVEHAVNYLLHHPPPERLPIQVILTILDRCENTIHVIEQKITEHKAVLPTLHSDDIDAIVGVYNEMLMRYNTDEFQSKHGANEEDYELCLIPFSEDVPSYFANVKYGTIFARKALSMCGLRNLVKFGVQVFEELKAHLFTSDPAKYCQNTGLELMHRVTGNTVDLDTVVLRCNDPVSLKTINGMNRRQNVAEFRNIQEFGQSAQANEMAINASIPLLEAFVQEFKLTAHECAKRHLNLTQPTTAYTIPVVHDNRSRGRWPVWHYINGQVNTFHANVPNVSDVVGALLRAPFAAARAFIRCRDDPVKLNAFFEDAISDSCFNAKWKALEAFNAELDEEGTIVKILEGIQANNQRIFTANLFDNDDDLHTNEIQAMVKMMQNATPLPMGRDSSGHLRLITQDDIVNWVNHPEQPI
jgi:hypothetical protein